MTPEERVAQIDQTLAAIREGWPFVLAELQDKARGLTESLIGQDNEQTRGRIKALRELMDMPETLQQERDGISAGLADSAPAD